MIDTGFGLEIWADEGEKTLNKRIKVLAYMEGQKNYYDAPDKSIYLICESSLFYFKKRGFEIIGNDKKGIDETVDNYRISQSVYLGTSSCHYNGDTYLINSILKTKASKKQKWLFPNKKKP